MITVTPTGRLGNQLFQYAFAYSISKQLNTSFMIYHDPDFVLYKYFRLRNSESFLQKTARLMYVMRRLVSAPPKRFEQTGWDDPSKIIGEALKHKRANWIGFFQSVAYFKPHQSEIKDLFMPRSEFQQQFDAKYGKLFSNGKKTFIIHVRRTDYLVWGSEKVGGVNMTLPMTYYDNCIRQLGDLSQYNIVVMSDDMDFVKDYFKSIPNVMFEHNSQIVDLLLLMHADVLITSNSSFAWWGAFLNRKNPMVFAPKHWIGFKIGTEYPVGITQVLNWVWVDVNAPK